MARSDKTLASSSSIHFESRSAASSFSRTDSPVSSVRLGLLRAIPNLAETTAFLAGTVWRVERKQARIEFFEGAPATRATHLRAHDRDAVLGVEQMRGAAADLERALDQIPRFQNSLRVDRADHDIDGVFLETFELSELRNRHQFSDRRRACRIPAAPPTAPHRV